MPIRMTHTVAELELSAEAYEEIAGKLRAVGYHHVFGDQGLIDMTGIGVTRASPPCQEELVAKAKKLKKSMDRADRAKSSSSS